MSISSNKQSTHLLKHVLVATLIILVVIFVTVRRVGSPSKPGAATDTTASQKIKMNGTMKLISQQDQQIYLLGQEIDLFLYASSQKTPVSGYDVVLSFDDSKISFDTAENMVSTVDFFVKRRTNGILITGVKKISQEDNLVFTDTPLARVSFIAKKPGNFTIEFVNRPGSTNESNLVTAQARDILTNATGYLGSIGQEISVSKGASQTLPNSSVTLGVDEVIIVTSQCADCSEKVVLSVSEGDEIKKLTFTQGGIEGKPFETLDAFGMVFEVGEIMKDRVTVRYASQ